MLLNQGIQDFAKYLKLVDRSDETVIGYKKELEYFNGFLSEKHNCPVYIKDISLKDMEDYLLAQKKRGMSTATRSRSVYVLRSFYNYLIKNDLVEKNLAARLEPVKVKQEERDFLTEEEFENLVEVIEQPVIKTVVETMFYTGGRISEVLSLKLQDVDLAERTIHIIEGKGGKDRDIPINDKLHKTLLNYLINIREADSENFFALKRTGSVSGSYVNRVINEAAEKIGLDKNISSHVLRHSFSTNLLEKGASVVSIQKLLGHASLSVTTRYLHQDKSKLSDAVNLL